MLPPQSAKRQGNLSSQTQRRSGLQRVGPRIAVIWGKSGRQFRGGLVGRSQDGRRYVFLGPLIRSKSNWALLAFIDRNSRTHDRMVSMIGTSIGGCLAFFSQDEVSGLINRTFMAVLHLSCESPLNHSNRRRGHDGSSNGRFNGSTDLRSSALYTVTLRCATKRNTPLIAR